MLIISVFLLFLEILKAGESAAITETPLFNKSTTDPNISLKEIEKTIEEMVKSITKSALPYIIRNSDLNVSSKCMSTFLQLFIDIRNLKIPAIKLLDAMAKPPYGILLGGFSMMGDYDECLDVRANKNGDKALTKVEEIYHGQYCMVEVMPPPVLTNNLLDYVNKRVNLTVFGKLGKVVEEFVITNFAQGFAAFKIGLCMPSTCSVKDLEELLKLVPLEILPMRVKHCDDGQVQELHIGQVMFITFLAVLGILVVFGTVLEAWFYLEHSSLKNHKNKLVQFLLAFSIYANTKKMMKVERNSSSSQIPIINGMYVIGSILVIMYHTYFMPFMFDFSSHIANLGKSMKNWDFTMMSTMGISIDAYFLFSGILLVYPRIRRGEKHVRIDIFKILFHRYLRFCAPMIVILGIMVSMPLIGSGPVWFEIFGAATENTKKWWWTYVLMLNNFLEVKDQSFFPFWFIPCLMQLTVIGVVLMWITSKSPRFGKFLIVAAGVSCNIALGILTYARNYPLTYALYYYYKRENFEQTIYTSPLSHVSSYTIGMLLGYFLAQNTSLKWSKVHVFLGWICSTFLVIGTQLFCYIARDGLDLDPTLTAVYAATHRSLYSLGLSWVILACVYGYGGAFTNFLSWKGFAVLSKLSFSGYLLHYIVISYHVSFTRVVLMISHFDTFIRYCGYLMVSCAAAYIFYITFELPLMYIDSLILPRKSSSKMSASNNSQFNGKCVNASLVEYKENFSHNILEPTGKEMNVSNGEVGKKDEESNT